ncbi:MAG: hypothetical protein KJ804_15430 [Proteobacteria bacterium]|nr:hypothetical protein [Pseudomonadota bacterium]MBU1059703.1 hypothetical protein [Pseudomonadota bacterium]
MNEIEKLQVLLPHWIEHNHGHAAECRKWTTLAAQSKATEDISSHLAAALLAMETVGECLEKALMAAGGAGKERADHHHHHHH